MAWATMTLPALYKYYKDTQNVDIFSGIVVGSTVPTIIDRQTLIDNILVQSAPFETVYTDPEYLHAAVTTWFATHARTFNKWGDALGISYDPLNNYDRTEISSDDEFEVANRGEHVDRENNVITNQQSSAAENSESNGTTIGSDNSAKKTGTSGSTNTVESENKKNGDTTTESVSAFDTSSWSNSKKTEVNGSESNSRLNAQNNAQAGTEDSISNTFNQNNDNAKSSNDVLNTGMNTDLGSETTTGNENRTNNKQHKLRAFGNIGVTTSQQMLQSELDIALWNIYEHITDMFIEEFCVLLY